MKFNKCKFLSCSILVTNRTENNHPRSYFFGLQFRLLSISIAMTAIAILCDCSKLVQVDSPPTSLTSDNIYSNDATAASVLTGLYTGMAKTSILWAENLNSIGLVSGLSSDELTLYGAAANGNAKLVQFYQNHLNGGAANLSDPTIWKNLYANLYIVNLAIERLSGSTSLTPSVKQQLLGEATFLRAFFYFYLVNLYGDVPLTTASNYQVNSKLSRSSSTDVYAQIIRDLKDAESLLSDYYVASDAKTRTSDRLRPNKWSASALLSRVYLYTGDCVNAEVKATEVINNKVMYDTVSVSNVFLKNSKESIWQLQPVNMGWNTEDARAFIIPSSGPTSSSSVDGYPVYLSDNLINAFEPGDLRKDQWINSVVVNGNVRYYYPYKYKSASLNATITEYGTVLRVAEQYLIRAEARAEQSKIDGAKNDLNSVRTRAGLPGTTAADKNSLLPAIQQERQRELFTEWGHRWLDLKRTGKIDEWMPSVSPLKESTWSPNWKWYPIPQYDIIQNQNLQQNLGY